MTCFYQLLAAVVLYEILILYEILYYKPCKKKGSGINMSRGFVLYCFFFFFSFSQSLLFSLSSDNADSQSMFKTL